MLRAQRGSCPETRSLEGLFRGLFSCCLSSTQIKDSAGPRGVPTGAGLTLPVLVSSNCHNKIPQTGDLNNRNLFSHSMGARSLRSVNQQG